MHKITKWFRHKLPLSVCILVVSFLLFGQSCDIQNVNKPPDGGVYRSKDGGESWTQVIRIDDKTSISKVNILSLVIDPKRVDTVYGGTRQNGLYRTENGGQEWTRLSVPATRVETIVINPQNTDIIYASGQSTGNGKIYLSADFGVTWEEVYSDPGEGSSIRALDIDPKSPHVLYAGTGSNGIIKSTDSGKSWFLLSWSQAQVEALRVDPQFTNRIYIGTSNKGLFRSDDNGENFLGFEVEKKYQNSNRIVSLALDVRSPGTIYAGSYYGLLRSTDAGINWNSINILVPPNSLPVKTIIVDPKNSNILYVSTSNTLYKSIDGGVNWIVKEIPTSREISTFAINPGNTTYIYLGVLFEK